MDDLTFKSRRSAQVTCHGAVSSNIPLASQAGLEILKAGGNAADAAVAVAAMLNVTEPVCTGLGGDAFCLFYDAKNNTVKGLNGSGRAPASLTMAKVQSDGFSAENMYPQNHGHAVTVPGAAAAWLDTVDTFGSGKVSLSRILKPAIDTAERGFPVTKVCSYGWHKGQHLLETPLNIHGHTMLVNGQAPVEGQLFRNPCLANTMKELVSNGKAGFYSGRVAKAIVDCVQRHGGVMTMEDLAGHVSTFEEPISTSYKGVRLWEISPNGQGIVALMALNILDNFDMKSMGHNSVQYIHTLSETLRLAFTDGFAYVADTSKVKVPVQEMLSKERSKRRARLIQSDKVNPCITADSIDYPGGQDTTYFTVADNDGNACSFINSKFHGFGSGIVPDGCGITLQDRGACFTLKEGHPNVLAPNKRPFHTIIPAMITSDVTGDLLGSYGVMGGYMQPQGHVQVLLNMLEFGMDPQASLDQFRIAIRPEMSLHEGLTVEDGTPDEVIKCLSAMGHKVNKLVGHDRSLFGRGHVITNGAWWSQDNTSCFDEPRERVWWTGTDPRGDGLAAGY